MNKQMSVRSARIKMFVSDMDGTLLGRDFKISPANVKAIRRLEERGIAFVAATGRIYSDAYAICSHRGLNPYIISNNGACIFNSNKEQIYGRWLPVRTAEEVVRFLGENNICYGIGTSKEYFVPENWETVFDMEAERMKKDGKQVSGEKIRHCKEEMAGQAGFAPVAAPKDYLHKGYSFYNISVLTLDSEVMRAVHEFLGQFPDLSDFFSSGHTMDIIARDGSKDFAVAYLAELFQIDMAQVAAIGDGMNDLAMLSKAGTSITLKNARDEIKSICEYVTRDCVEDGVAEAIDYVIGKEEVSL